MLSQRTIQLWEGGFYSARGAVRETHRHVDTERASCSLPWESFSLQRRRRNNNTWRKLHFCRSVVVCSQGIQSAPAEHGFVRSSDDDDDGANQLGLGSDDVRVSPLSDARNGHEGLDAKNGPTTSSSNRRLALRSPAPVPEGSRPDSEAPEDPNDEVRTSPEEEPSGVAAEPDAPKNSFETFVRARAVGRELANRCKDDDGGGGGGEELGFVSEKFYTPRVGDHVMGIVASGTFCRLDVNIGAKELGHLFRKDVMPLDLCNTGELAWKFQTSPAFAPPRGIRFAIDEEVLNLLPEPPLAVELGTVLAMEVQGMSPSGRALLSARSVAREYAWQRARQLLEYNAVLEVQITEWTSAGLIAKVEGLRAFLPTYYLVNHVPEPSTPVSVSYKEYVGQKFTVMISSVDEKRSNLVISEKKAWMAKNAYIGALFEGTVTEIRPYGVHLLIKDTHISGVLHISNISRARVANIASLFSIGEKVKAMVVPSSAKNKISLSTADLESEHGLILRDKQAVYQSAERIAAEYAKAYRSKHSVETDDRVEAVDQNLVIANLDWLDFGDQGEVD